MYQNEIVEKFESPSTWTPGTTILKTVTVKNTDNIQIAVRVSYTEKWVNGNVRIKFKYNDEYIEMLNLIKSMV